MAELEGELSQLQDSTQHRAKLTGHGFDGERVPLHALEPLVRTSVPTIRLDSQGSISFSSSTSFLNGAVEDYPEGLDGEDLKPGSLHSAVGSHRRQQLVQNAWQQRSLVRDPCFIFLVYQVLLLYEEDVPRALCITLVGEMQVRFRSRMI